jgi:hypothetical protein
LDCNTHIHRNVTANLPLIALLNKLFFSKTENRKVKQVLSGELVPVGGGGHKERVQEGEYGRNVMYSCMKMEK